MNPAKCVFGVQVRDFLGFVVHQRGIEVLGDKAKAIINAPAPKTKKELQQLLGKINFLRRFISNSIGKVKPFSSLLKLQGAKEFVWESCHQEAFDRIKEYLANPPVLVPPKPGIPLKPYISASKSSIAGFLAQDDINQEGRTIKFATVSLEHIPRERNFAANELAQIATRVSLADGVCERILKLEKRTLP
ncbi:hypothetical protein ACLB2K_065530 [Fragaria x ananassa]